VAYPCAAHRDPCESVDYDAYHRVLHREFIDGENRAEAGCLADVESRRAGCGPSHAPCNQLRMCAREGLQVVHHTRRTENGAQQACATAKQPRGGASQNGNAPISEADHVSHGA
jgi:hypothetical protein